MRVAGICPKHGYYKGEGCPVCEKKPDKVLKRPVFPFTDPKTFGDNREISSWKHFDKECKKKGLTADKVSFKPKKSDYRPAVKEALDDRRKKRKIYI